MASRLIDKLLVNPSVSSDHKAYLKHSTVISADNVQKYFETFDFVNMPYYDLLDQLPSIRPPLNNMFIEFYVQDMDRYIGCYVSPTKMDEAFIVEVEVWQEKSVYSLGMGRVMYAIDEDGKLNEASKKTTNMQVELYFEGFSQYMVFLLSVTALWTLAFMNCKNAVLEPIEPNAQENKRRAKHGKLPLMRYHVLKIKPFGNRSDNESQGGTHASPALHIRRGHFATYTDAAPLFGKYVGTYWKDQMLVGRKSDRVVVKDYEMDLTGVK